jgi:hypothetical protein
LFRLATLQSDLLFLLEMFALRASACAASPPSASAAVVMSNPARLDALFVNVMFAFSWRLCVGIRGVRSGPRREARENEFSVVGIERAAGFAALINGCAAGHVNSSGQWPKNAALGCPPVTGAPTFSDQNAASTGEAVGQRSR